MFDDKIADFERIGEYRRKPGEESDEDDNNNPEADAWNMNDMKFAGEWGYGPSGEPAIPEEALSPETSNNDELAGANQLTSYGLDTASRVYGFDAVMRAVMEADVTGADAENPIGAVYQRIAPSAEARQDLYREIRREQVRGNQYNTDPAVVDAEEPRLGINRLGDFYDKTQRNAEGGQASVDAIRALHRLIEMLRTSERFADVRERAAERGKDIIEYLVSDKENPTLTDFFNRVGTEMTEDKAEEVVAELEEQVNPDLETEKLEQSVETNDDDSGDGDKWRTAA